MGRICAFPGCTNPFRSHGLCQGHSAQRRRNPGRALTPLFSRKRPDHTLPRIIYDEFPCPVPGLAGPCHVFRGAKTQQGYGAVGTGKGKEIVLVHRYVWQMKKGEIPEGLMIDHQCRNRACCNIVHLRLVTPQINALENNDSVVACNATKTCCPQGHTYDEENTAVNVSGHRRCKECNRIRRRRNYRRSKVQQGD